MRFGMRPWLLSLALYGSACGPSPRSTATSYPITDIAAIKRGLGIHELLPDRSAVPEGYSFSYPTLTCQRGVVVAAWDEKRRRLSRIRNGADVPDRCTEGKPTPDGYELRDSSGGLCGHLVYESAALNMSAGFRRNGKESGELSELLVFEPSGSR